MTSDHDGDPLAEALWFAIDLGYQEEMSANSPVVIGTDHEEWGVEIRHWLSDVHQLRCHVTEELGS